VKLTALAASLFLLLAPPAAAATLEPVGSFAGPIFVTSDPADPDRLLVVEREGRVIEVREGKASELADLTSLVSCCVSERGLHSIAPAPDFATSGRFYAVYTGEVAAGGAEGDVHLDSFRPGGAGLIREPILAIDHSTRANHNGGQLQFGPDGHLYLSVGDGGGAGDPLGSGQSLDTLLGKILRIDPRPGQAPAYAIPPGNPFAAGAGRDEIWSYGLRNPWRVSFDRATGDLVIADVGQMIREEVDLAPSPAAGVVGGAGANYGWSCREGFIAFPSAPAGCTGASGFTDPVFDYPHTDPGDGGAHGCAITGGYVVRDPGLGDLYGRYVYADFCQGQIRSLALPAEAGGRATGDRFEGLTVPNPTSFGEDACGRIYVASNGGAVYRLVGPSPTPCAVKTATPSGSPPLPPPAPPPPGADPVAGVTAPRVVLRAASRQATGSGVRLLLAVRVSPCAGLAGAGVQLNRGGRPSAAKQLNLRCVARFRRRVMGRSTFRALLPESGYRSQVLTIALAKPRP
jgi:hypothetical protein